MSLLEFDNIKSGYDESVVLHGLSMSVEEGSVTSLLGRNGVGKTTTLRTITGQLSPRNGAITFRGEDITGLPTYEIHSRGIGMVTEERDVFPDLTVRENLRAPREANPDAAFSIEELFEFFPTLVDLKASKAKNLSGGEQQMLVIARALRSGPELLLLDEPSEGLAPQIVEDVADIIREIAQMDTTVLLVEQNVNLALDLADYNYVMDQGRIAMEDTSEALRKNPEQAEKYLSISRREA